MDFSFLRHSAGIVTLKKTLSASLRKGQFHHGCLCGHRGSGKSTELLSLKKWADDQRFQTVHAEVDAHVGIIDLEFSDFYLLAATMVERAMLDLGKPLPQDKLRRVIEWFAEVIEEDKANIKSEIGLEAGAQLGGKLPLGLGKLFAKFMAGIKAASSHAITTRQKLREFPNYLIDLTNDLLNTANEMLKGQKPRGLLLLFDNLDRYEPERIDRVLFKNCDLIRSLKSHAVFTIPIALEYEPLTGAPQDSYGFSVVLPILALRRQTDPWAHNVVESPSDPAAIAAVREALALRIDLNALFQGLDDVDLLVKMSGGCIRDLMHLVTQSFKQVDGLSRATHQAVIEAIQEMRATYSTAVFAFQDAQSVSKPVEAANRQDLIHATPSSIPSRPGGSRTALRFYRGEIRAIHGAIGRTSPNAPRPRGSSLVPP